MVGGGGSQLGLAHPTQPGQHRCPALCGGLLQLDGAPSVLVGVGHRRDHPDAVWPPHHSTGVDRHRGVKLAHRTVGGVEMYRCDGVGGAGAGGGRPYYAPGPAGGTGNCP